MKYIDNAVEKLFDELDGAKSYAEEYIRHKARGDMPHANKYREMAQDELRHASIIHEFSQAEIDGIKRVYTIPVDAEEKWDKAHKHYTECVGWIRQMLA